MRLYDITSETEDDLTSVWLYSEDQWSEAQANKYIRQLYECFDAVVDGRKHIRDLTDIYPDLKSCSCQQHHIFFLAKERPIIVAVLHQRMSLLERLAERLNAD